MAQQYNIKEITSSHLSKAAIQALEKEGYEMEKIPGKGRSNTWQLSRGKENFPACIRTTRNRWFAFHPLKDGTYWKTLDDVEYVVLAGLNSEDDPQHVDVFIIPTDKVHDCFKRARKARIKAGYEIKDGNPMWICMDKHDESAHADYVGSDVIEGSKQIAKVPLSDVLDTSPEPKRHKDKEKPAQPSDSISEIMFAAREKIARLAGVSFDAVKLDCRIVTID